MAEFGKINRGQIKQLLVTQKNIKLWSLVHMLCSSVRVNDNIANVDLVLNTPEDLLAEAPIRAMQRNLLKRSKELGLDNIDFNISIVSNRNYHFELNPDLKR